MNERLLEIIEYKAGGKQIAFAEMMGWSPQYIAKLVRGENFGLSPGMSQGQVIDIMTYNSYSLQYYSY